MKEITRIKTVQITEIVTTSDDMKNIIPKEESAIITAKQIKQITQVDDVKVINVQDFIRDI